MASQTSTHVFKVTNSLSLTIDISRPPTQDKGIALLHFHGGFLIIGEKTTFPPHWLIQACHTRGWTYATASYRLMPESSGLEILSDTLAAVSWLHTHITSRVIIAGSSAGGYLALATATHPQCPRPLAVLSIYGMLSPESTRYIEPGVPLTAPVPNLATVVGEVEAAMSTGTPIDGYAFPADPATDRRFGWIAALHEAGRFPDVLARRPGLAAGIRERGVQAVPEECRGLFPGSFGLSREGPVVVLVHGDADVLVGVEQSVGVAERIRELGGEVVLEVVKGKGHGFEVHEVIDVDAEGDGQDIEVRKALRRVVDALERAVDGGSS